MSSSAGTLTSPPRDFLDSLSSDHCLNRRWNPGTQWKPILMNLHYRLLYLQNSDSYPREQEVPELLQSWDLSMDSKCSQLPLKSLTYLVPMEPIRFCLPLWSIFY